MIAVLVLMHEWGLMVETFEKAAVPRRRQRHQ